MMNSASIAADSSKQPQKLNFRWWHGLAIFLTANFLSVLPAGINGDEAFYNSFQKPVVAPPDWLFAPMWLVLNITSLIALAKVANQSARTRRHQLFFWSEGLGWVLFAAFNTLYFGLDSPILGAVNTSLGLLVAIVSVFVGWRIHRRAALFVGLRVLWLMLATYVSIYVAVNNVDLFFALSGF
jgi:tryptophan-rich sensory protein